MAKLVLGGIGDAAAQIVFSPENRCEFHKKVMKESEYLLLLNKRLSGEINPEESVLLETWLSQSPNNEELAKNTQQLWEKAEGYGKTFTPNLELDFQKVQARIRQQEQPKLRASLGQRLMRAAAVLALLVSAVWGWQQFSADNGTEVLILAETLGAKSAALPDGSQVWLREGSKLAYTGKLDGTTRQVKLYGEGYFEVKHDPAHPFKVELENGGTVEVLGTQFDVSQTASQTSVLVRSGKVRFSPKAQAAGPVLTANQKAVFEKEATQVKVSTVSSLNELSWQTGGLEFVNTPLEQVVADLEKYYAIKIKLSNPAMANCPHSAPLTSQAIDQVLETLALTHQLKVKKLTDGSFELSGGVCR